MKTFAFAALPLADIYDLPRRKLFTGGDYVLVMGEHAAGDLEVEPESIFAMTPKRATLWLPTVPILSRRRPFIPPWDFSDIDV